MPLLFLPCVPGCSPEKSPWSARLNYQTDLSYVMALGAVAGTQLAGLCLDSDDILPGGIV